MHPVLRPAVVICAVLALCSIQRSAFAANTFGIPLSTVAGDQTIPVACSDGAGGVIVAWHDQRPTGPAAGTVYAQHLNAAGVPQWTADGVQVTTIGDLGPPVIVADGSGGAFIAFGGDGTPPRVQRLSPSGTPQWTADGVQFTNSTARDLAICADVGGSGGAIMAWRFSNLSGDDIYGQRVNSSGTTQWGTSGTPIAMNSTMNERFPALISDNAGGAFFTWNSTGIRIQRYNSNGNSVWSQEPLSTSSNAEPASLDKDGSGGVVVSWSGGGSVFAQRVDATGGRLWPTPGAGVLLGTGRSTSILSDGAGGATVTWLTTTMMNDNIFAQRLNSIGTTLWNANGNSVCSASNNQLAPKIVTDGAGGSIITWYDLRSGGPSNDDIFAQRMDGGGLPQWTFDGNVVCDAVNFQESPTIVSDGAGGAWIAWQDFRNAANWDIYASRVSGSGSVVSVGTPRPALAEARAWPNPFVDRVQMSFALAKSATVHMRVFDLHGRAVADLGTAALEAGAHEIGWDGRRSDGRRAAEGLYFLRVDGPGIALSRAVVALN